MKCNVVARAAPKNEILKKMDAEKRLVPFFCAWPEKMVAPFFWKFQRKIDDPPYLTKEKMMTPPIGPRKK